MQEVCEKREKIDLTVGGRGGVVFTDFFFFLSLHSLPVFTFQSVIILTSSPLIGLIYHMRRAYSQLNCTLFGIRGVVFSQAGIQFMYVGSVQLV